ncbi:hypothetical protein PoB_005316300 [Plakobranchus ocellatus]|uniref:Uncharacterized protein n=1 Tax=Plakobranchus ocellatus TaxID=259542 RepID=A0AAV4C5F9_9GAST|nr:hypothetical protein PoB_005316300 [Plakobranchus ocellatus]
MSQAEVLVSPARVRKNVLNKLVKKTFRRDFHSFTSCHRRIFRTHTCSGVYDPRHLHGKYQGTGAEKTGVMCSHTLSASVDRNMNYVCRLLCQFTALGKNVLHVLSNRRIIPPLHLIREVCMENSLVHLRT